MPKPKPNRCATRRWDACIEFLCLANSATAQKRCRYYKTDGSRSMHCAYVELWPTTTGCKQPARVCFCREAQDEALGLPLAEKVEELEADLARLGIEDGIEIDKLKDELDRVKAYNEALEGLTRGSK